MTSFRAALGEFTCLTQGEGSGAGIGPQRLLWLPLIGLVAALATLAIYLPLSWFYLPAEPAAVLGLMTVSCLRGFKAEAAFGHLADHVFGVSGPLRQESMPAAPGVTTLCGAFLLRFTILRFFFLPDSARLLAFGVIAGFLAPMFARKGGSTGAHALGLIALAATAALCVGARSPVPGFPRFLPGPVFCTGLVYLASRLIYRIDGAEPWVSAASYPAELVGYTTFLLVRYHFLG
ncbi:MAG TPA: hypothetical protein VGD78_13080 [Chthoniobacterales bacterium]